MNITISNNITNYNIITNMLLFLYKNIYIILYTMSNYIYDNAFTQYKEEVESLFLNKETFSLDEIPIFESTDSSSENENKNNSSSSSISSDSTILHNIDIDDTDINYQIHQSLKNNISITDYNDIIQINKEQPNAYENFYCCLCGFHSEIHHIKTHRFIKLDENYRCKKCSKFFFQHKHSHDDCIFEPHKFI